MRGSFYENEYKQKALKTFKGESLRAWAVILGGGGLGYALWTVLASLGDEEEQKKMDQEKILVDPRKSQSIIKIRSIKT